MIKKNITINTQNFGLSIFKKKKNYYLYIYNDNFFCIFKTTKIIKIINTFFLKLEDTTTVNKMNKFIKQFYLCNFTKIKFSGKGYKIKKNSKQSLILLFNRSHTTILWWKNTFIKKIKKYKLYIKYNNTNKTIIQTLLCIRPINIFTKKGLRTSRQILFKKKGKK